MAERDYPPEPDSNEVNTGLRDGAAELEFHAGTLLDGYELGDPDIRAIAMLLCAVCRRLEAIDVELQRMRGVATVWGETGRHAGEGEEAEHLARHTPIT